MSDPVLDLRHHETARRLAAVRRLNIQVTVPYRNGTNLHVHTNHSFSVFSSPSEAAWEARQAGIEVFGINDAYTTAGFDEFGKACIALGMPAVFGIQVVALDGALATDGRILNDPSRPGRMFLCGKGVTRPDDAQAQATLVRLRGVLQTRLRSMLTVVDERFRTTLGAAGPSWEELVGLTPSGNVTERHLARAVVERIRAVAVERSMPPGDAFAAIVGQAPHGSESELHDVVRSQLLRPGRPCHVTEDPAAYPPVADVRDLLLRLGAIPTYPVLGNPITHGESDLRAWCDRLEGWGIHALEVVPARNTDDRITAVVAEAARRGWPVFDGTEHNTPARMALTTRWGLDERFRPVFRAGALVALGHQELCSQGQPGYLDASGVPTPQGFDRCLAAGERRLEALGAT